jgi:hypothetical protein
MEQEGVTVLENIILGGAFITLISASIYKIRQGRAINDIKNEPEHERNVRLGSDDFTIRDGPD